MKIVVTGSEGKLGKELVKRGCIPIIGDITNPEEIKDAIQEVSPDVLIHCAAMTDVKQCEENRMEAYKVNCRGTNNVVEAFPKGLLIFTSTVHVFNGRAWHAYNEKHAPDPINIYGLTKYSAEMLCKFRVGKSVVVRISKLFDADFILPTLKRLQAGEIIEFTDVITRSFTYTPYMADALLTIATKPMNFPDVLHVCSKDIYSYYLFWLTVLSEFKVDYYSIKPRNYELKDEIPRPLRGGLHNGLALSCGIYAPDALQGIKDIKDKV